MKDISKEDLEANPVLQDSMMFRLIQISEQANTLLMNLEKKMRKYHGQIYSVLETE